MKKLKKIKKVLTWTKRFYIFLLYFNLLARDPPIVVWAGVWVLVVRGNWLHAQLSSTFLLFYFQI